MSLSMPSPLVRGLFAIIIIALVVLVHLKLLRWVTESHTRRRSITWLLRGLAALSAFWILASVFVRRAPGLDYVPVWLAWMFGLGITWGFCSLLVLVLSVIWRRLPAFNPRRRGFLVASRTALIAAPAAVAGFGVFIGRKDIGVREIDLRMAALPKDLDGFRLVQLSDIHLGPFFSQDDLARAVDMANDTRAHLAVVTGDLITRMGDPLDACLQELSRLKADLGVWGCLGNHETYANTEDYTEREGARRGIRFLRQRAHRFSKGSARLNLAGVDYQSVRRPYLENAESLVAPDSFNILLSHNPDVLPIAARKGFDLTIAGHTHGGQINVEILAQNISLARFITPYIYGTYRAEKSALYVTRGLGTVGVPARLGAPPEVALIRLCAT